MSDRLRVALVYDMDACRGPTGVTRHALAQLERLAAPARGRADALVSGRIAEPDGLAYWESLDALPRRELPLRTRDALRCWRLAPWPPVEWWTGAVDWVYCPAEYVVPTRRARRAVTSHDVLQDLTLGGPRRRERLAGRSPRPTWSCRSRGSTPSGSSRRSPAARAGWRTSPTRAEDLFFEPADRARAGGGPRPTWGCRRGCPYLLSVANFQPRKNLVRLIRAAGRLPEVAARRAGPGAARRRAPRPRRGRSARRSPRPAAAAVVRMPGYRQGRALRAAYAEATALVFPSTCESFGIPAVEAMAQGCPVALADSTALPEIGGEAGWYFDPESDEGLAGGPRATCSTRPRSGPRRADLGRAIAGAYRWSASCARGWSRRSRS